jgi:hypothetical protein
MATNDRHQGKNLPVFLSPAEFQERTQAGKLLESDMKTVAELAAADGSAEKKKRLVIKCVDTPEGVVCTYKWV